MQFVDEAQVHVKAGDGGNGRISFLRLKFRRKAGPDGGNGGRGGDVIFKASARLNTLTKFLCRRNFIAANGATGGSSCCTGKNGTSLLVEVPIGTQIFFPGGELWTDLEKDGTTFTVAIGGNGGFGNVHFKSSVNQAPHMANAGATGQEFDLLLQLKVLSDVGLVGLPNAGKSAFLATVSNARPKIADYSFTTLKPQLGSITREDVTFVMADLPGLVAGAAKGKGLGYRFLKHMERCEILLHLVDGTSANVVENYRIVRREIELGSPPSASKVELVALTKSDKVAADVFAQRRSILAQEIRHQVFPISCQNGFGIQRLLEELRKILLSKGFSRT